MLRLALVRHGETDWNTVLRYQGQTDVPLNERGRRQAARVGERLAALRPDALYSSDLRRAGETAVIIGGHTGLVPRFHPGLREMHFGRFEGKTAVEIGRDLPEESARWWADTLNERPPEGESMRDVASRVAAWWADTRARHDGETVVVVGHGGPLRLLVSLALGAPPETSWRLGLANASLSIVELERGQARLVLLNDVCHCGDA